MESVTWVTESYRWEQEWITDTSVTLKENEILEALNYEIDVPVLCSGDCNGSQHRLMSTTSSCAMEQKLKNTENSQPCDVMRFS